MSWKLLETRAVLQIARREWENIAISLEDCGDFGKLDLEYHIIDSPDLVKNLIEMENKVHIYDYLTLEAGSVFTELAYKAAERLGLKGSIARSFAGGYSWVRTGWFDLMWTDFKDIHDLEQHLIKQIFFFKIFFPKFVDLTWPFDSPSVMENLNAVYNRFVAWQNNPIGYIRDYTFYKEQIEPIWTSLSRIFENAIGKC
jgi:hypothetical protein